MPYVKDKNRKSFRQSLRQTSNVQTQVQRLWKQEEEQRVEYDAKKYKVPYVNLKFIPIDQEALKVIPLDTAKKGEIVVFQRAGNTMKVAVADLFNPLSKKILTKLQDAGMSVHLFYVSHASLEKAFKSYGYVRQSSAVVRDELDIPEALIQEVTSSVSTLKDFSQQIQKHPTTELMRIIMSGAIAFEASDIHIEPEKNIIRLRYRIDGMLQDILFLPIETYSGIVSRIKTLSSFLLNVNSKAQDGRFSVMIKDAQGNHLSKIDIRVSTLPGKNGEVVVMRLLRANIEDLDIHTYQMATSFKEMTLRNLAKPQGMILLSGPTGSGKTTSMYTFLNYLNRVDSNIITIEDPIEYRIKNINQTQVDIRRGYDFPDGLKAIVRQDPDIIMVGEIRDQETATIASNAAITGHMVLSTIHTNHSVGIISRLKEFNINPDMIVSAMNLYVAQRLLRKLCECKIAYTPSESERLKIQKALALISPKARIEIPKSIETIYRPSGCEKCLGIGYKGRFALFEMFESKENITRQILAGASEFEIFRKAIENGIITLYQDGMLHVVNGDTSIEEVEVNVGDTQYIDELYEQTLSSSLMRGIKVHSLKYGQLTQNNLQTTLDTVALENSLEVIFEAAINFRSTDIHFEPEKDSLAIRFRIDGILYSLAKLSKEAYPQILTQIKILTGVRLDQGNTIQEGRFSVFKDNSADSLDTRVSIIPGGYGQTVVIRMLYQDTASLSLEQLGMSLEHLKLLEPHLTQTQGLILVTGPTSSGKSTTLYSILQKVNRPGVKIITIEDPIEYRQTGILQTSINQETGYTFATALRALLRQNPNIIMLGEIRDQDTAKVAMQAAATGHLLFSTLHTNDSISALLRLQDLGISLTDSATFVKAIIAQRIVRTLPEDCRVERKLTDEEITHFKSILPSRHHHKIPAVVFESSPNPQCPQGYKGISAIFEICIIDTKLINLIPSMKDITKLKQVAVDAGMDTLEISGILKVFEGITDIAEVERVLGVQILPKP
jgi:type IV pilus assembly protein PilB